MRFSSSRTEYSNAANSTTLFDLVTPLRRTKSRSAAAGTPRRRTPASVGMRGSSQPVTRPSLHQPRQDALRHHGVGDVEPREFVLMRTRRHRQVVDQPVVQRPMILELQRAERVRDALDRVRLAVRVVVGGIDAPGVAGARMLGVQDAIQHRIAQVHVGRRHVDLRAQHARAVGELAGAHAAEQVEVLLHRAIAIGRVLPRFGQRAALRAHPIRRRVIHVGLAFADQVLGPFVELLEIVRRMIEMLAPVEAEPVHVALDRVDELLLLLGRVGVVEAQMAAAADIPPPRRSSGRSTWRGRYAGSRSAPAESG